MIAEFVAMYRRGHDFSHLAAYALGISESKSSTQEERCHYLTDNNMHLHATGGMSKKKAALKPLLAEEVAQQLHEIMAMNSAVRKPVNHIVISAAPEDAPALTESMWLDMAHQFMSEMGYDDTRWFASLHQDTDKPHIHIIACTIQDLPGYPVVKRWQEYARAEKVMRKLELKHGLREVPSPKDGCTINNAPRVKGKDAIRQAVDVAINNAHEEQSTPSLLTLFYNLRELAVDVEVGGKQKKQGVEMRIQWQNGKPKGLSFNLGGFSCTGTKLGAEKRYTLAGLAALGIEVPKGQDLLALETLTAPPRSSYKKAEAAALHSDHDVTVSMPKADSDLLLRSKRVAPPSFIEQEADKCIWSYRIRIYRPKPGTKLSVAEILKAVTKSLKEALSFALKLLGHRSPSIETLEAEPAVDYAPLKATLCPGTRFDEDKAVDRICKVKQESVASEPALEQAGSDTSDDSSAFPAMEHSETPSRPRGDARESWNLGE